MVHIHGFAIPLVDFFFFCFSVYLADLHFKPTSTYRWIFFVLFIITALLFFGAWLVDLGAHF